METQGDLTSPNVKENGCEQSRDGDIPDHDILLSRVNK